MTANHPRWVVYPILLPAIIVLQQAIAGGVEPPGFVRPLLVALAAAVVALLLWIALVRSAACAGLLTLGALLVLFSRDPILAALALLRDALGIGGATLALGGLVFLLLAAIALALSLGRRGRLPTFDLARTTRGLNFFSVLLLAIVLLPAVPRVPTWLADATAERGLGPAAAGQRDGRDIFLFILDGYPRADELADRFGIDISAFVSELEGRGFEVDPDSTSNYTYTGLTFTSMLELDYLSPDRELEIHDEQLRDRLRAALRGGRAVQALREAGYRLVATAPGWEHVSLRTGVDDYLDRPELSDLERILLQQTWLPDVPLIPGDLFFRDLRARVLGILDDAAAVARTTEDRPVFAMVHLPAPHLPFVFGADGGVAPFSSRQYGGGRPSEFGLTDAEFALAYEVSLERLNQHLLRTVDEIVAASGTDPVIVLTSDHGYSDDSLEHGPDHLHNFLAYRTPEAPGLLDHVTPVNLLRILLGEYVGGDVGEPVPDRFFTTRLGGQRLTLREIDDPR